jgi:hypothetical protein
MELTRDAVEFRAATATDAAKDGEAAR